VVVEKEVIARRTMHRHGRDIILFIRRRDTRIIDANEAAFKAYGYSRDELLSLRIYDLRSAETLPLTAAQLQEADSSGILFETVHQRKDGTAFAVEVSSFGAELNGERCILSIIRDISEQKRATELSRRLSSAVEQTDEQAFEGFAVFHGTFSGGDWAVTRSRFK